MTEEQKKFQVIPYPFFNEERKAEKVFRAIVEWGNPGGPYKYLFPELCETQAELDYYSEGPQTYCKRMGWNFVTLEELNGGSL